MLTMHGRTRLAQYEGEANWEAIGQARKKVAIPVVANGDIRTPEDLARCAEQSGCSRFMIGRGALMRPELFRLLTGQQKEEWTPSGRIRWLCGYGDLCIEKGLPETSAVGRVKAILRYMAQASEPIARVFRTQRACPTWDALREGMMRSVGVESEETADRG